jgi:REP element-mobilizing transposase RayT
MSYDPQKHNRRSMRLKGYDYTQAGAYFVTICTQRRIRFFQNERLYRIAAQCWQAIPDHVPSVELDEWVIMPDHIHGIIVIVDSDDTERKGHNDHDDLLRTGVQLNAPPTNLKDPQRHPKRHTEPTTRDPANRFSIISPHRNTLAVIVRTYKAAVTTLCHRVGYNEFGWQRNYHERIIRTEADLSRIHQYIIDNPLNW